MPGHGPAHKLLRAQVPLIMIGCLANNAEDTAILAEHQHTAKDTNVPFHLVGVTCDYEEHGR
ncbi:hypothetical protein EK21DRAFT_115633 [Setomelanomma holmii]|uniref:Uncharacterized protein n=1 Tax=Setomelanomma holmii TaxID=210430 RepID=A0A9P4H1K7_9PLEO|nr:hypothetical protein EK21DRAFT_115633 [Setomelanomma holmii]